MVEFCMSRSVSKKNDAELENEQLWKRYARQIMLPELGEHGQRQLQAARVLIVGVGGLGSAVSLYLAAAGIGKIWLSDADKLEVSNLQRQILYTSNDLNGIKSQVAAKRLKLLNPAVSLHAVSGWSEDSASSLLFPDGKPVDLVIDATDNMTTRHSINRHCFTSRIPLLSAAATGWHGQLMLFDFRQSTVQEGGCYHCLFPYEETVENCSTLGILGPVVGIMGSYQALEAIKFLTGISSPLQQGTLLRFDAINSQWQATRRVCDPECSVCGSSRHVQETPYEI